MRRTLHIWKVAAIFTGLTLVHTWPLVTDLAHLSRMDAPDAQLNAWAISWVAHRLPTDPLHLFDANIFHPAPHTLAYSEPLLVPGLIGAPLLWLGASPVATYNVLLMVGLIATSLAMYILVLRFTNDQWAAVLSGCLLAFNAHTLTRFTHLQAFHVEWLPLALWALDRLLTAGRHRDACWLALFVTLSALTSGYVAIFVVVALASALIVRPDRWLHRRGLALAGQIIGAAVMSVIVVAIVLWPYAVANQGLPIRRPLSEVSMFGATLDQYLATGGQLHYALWSHRFFASGGDALFPGVVAISLAALALVMRRTHRATWMLGSIALVGLVLSFGHGDPSLRVAVLGLPTHTVHTGGEPIRLPLPLGGRWSGGAWLGWYPDAMERTHVDDRSRDRVPHLCQSRSPSRAGWVYTLFRLLTDLQRHRERS